MEDMWKKKSSTYFLTYVRVFYMYEVFDQNLIQINIFCVPLNLRKLQINGASRGVVQEVENVLFGHDSDLIVPQEGGVP